jgi:hypothetical protein
MITTRMVPRYRGYLTKFDRVQICLIFNERAGYIL